MPVGTIIRINTRNFSFIFVCLILLLVTDRLTANASAPPADDFVITVKTDNPGTSTSTQFTIPTYLVEPFAAEKALFASNPSKCRALDFGGNATTTITGAGIFSNSDCSSFPGSIRFGSGTANIQYDVTAAGLIYVVGSLTAGSINSYVPHIEIEPIAEPDCTGLPARDDSGTALQPGIYAGITISAGDVFLEPGLYCLDGDLTVIGGTLTGDGVTIFMRGTSGMTVTGGNAYLTTPKNNQWADGSGKYWNGMLVYQQYGNAASLLIYGNVDSYYQGSVFVPDAQCTLAGTQESVTQNLQLVCNTIELTGNSDIIIDYHPENQYQPMPPYNYNVDCDNDGIDEAVGQTGDYTCTYPSPGTYTIRIRDNAGDGTGFPRIYFNNSGDKEKLLSIDQWGTGKWASMAHAFSGCANMNMAAVDAPDLSHVTEMQTMFAYAANFNGEIGGWDTGNVTNMDGMFYEAAAFNQDISTWNTANVRSMISMFEGASAFDADLGGWDTSALIDADSMFSNVQLSTPNYDALLIGWDAQNLQTGVPFSGGNSTYCAGAAARENMINAYGWSITDGGKADSMPLTVSFLAPVAGGSLMQPRALLVVDASDFSGISKVEFWGRVLGSWTLLGTDADGSDGWQAQWATYDIDAASVDVKAVAYDRCGNQTPVQLNGVALTQTHAFGNGFETRGGGEAEIAEQNEAIFLQASVKITQMQVFGSRLYGWILME